MFRSVLQNNTGAVLIEFVFALLIFAAFMYGLFVISWWGIGAEFLQQAAHDAAGKYATVMDDSVAKQEVANCLGRWAYLFIQPGSVSVDVWGEGDTAHAEVSAKPKFTKLYFYSLPLIEKTSSCTFEYRFRHQGEFLH